MTTLFQGVGSRNGTDKILDIYEKGVKEKIAKSEAPFLGMFVDAFKSSKMNVKMKLEQIARDEEPVKLCCDLLLVWPGLLGSYIADSILANYGNEGTAAVYKHLSQALGFPIDTPEKRKKLYQAFRLACLKLDLPVGQQKKGSYMAREYLRQAGFPLSTLARLAESMVRFAQAHHAPLPDDDEAVSVWQDHFREMGGGGFTKTALTALARDEDAYFSRVFLRFYWGENQPREAGNHKFLETLEREVTRARKTGKTNSGKGKLLLPEIRFMEDTYGLFLPPVEDEPWQVHYDNRSAVAILPHEDGSFIPFSRNFQRVSAQIPERNISWSKTLWEDHGNHRFLVFKESSGVLAGSGHLQPALKADEEPLYLKPGNYVALLRFQPGDHHAHPLDCGLHLLNFKLNPGETFSLKRGSNLAVVAVEAKPHLLLEGGQYEGLKGQSFFMSRNLALQIHLPDEVRRGHQWRLFIKTSHGLEPLEVPLDGLEAYTRLELEPFFSTLTKGMTLISVELCQETGKRVYARTSGYVWIGLQEVENRVVFHGTAENLAAKECENLRVETQRITFRERFQNTFRMVFNIRENYPFAVLFRIPGLFISLIDGETGEERFLDRGSVISIDYQKRDKLKIYFNQPGFLKLGAFNVEADFVKKGCHLLPLSTLKNELQSGENQLFLVEETEKIPLVRLTTPHKIDQARYIRHGEDISIQFTLPQAATRARIEIVELLSGEIHQVELPVNDPQVIFQDQFRIEFENDGDQSLDTSIKVTKSTFPPGVYICRWDLYIGERWGELRNQRGDAFLLGFAWDPKAKSFPSDYLAEHLFRQAVTSNLDLRIARFQRIYHLLLHCYAQECWDAMEWLKSIWTWQLEDFRNAQFSPEQHRRFLRVCLLKPEELGSQSWIPLLNPAAKAPGLFTQPISHYEPLPEKEDEPRHDGVLHCLRDLGGFSACHTHELVRLQDISLMYWSGFSNFFQVSQGAEPQGFKPSLYRDALSKTPEAERWRWLKREGWRPGKGHYLDALHLRYAQTRFQENYNASSQGFENLRSGMLFTARRVRDNPPDHLFQDLPQDLAREHWLDDIRVFTLTREEEESGLCEESPGWCRRLIAVYAKVCRLEARRPGVYPAFWTWLERKTSKREAQLSIELGHLLYLGYDLFAFYLMLWELAFKFDCHGERK